jgi:hypothetical protein
MLRRASGFRFTAVVTLVAWFAVATIVALTRARWQPLLFGREIYWFRVTMLPNSIAAGGADGAWWRTAFASEEGVAAFSLLLVLPAVGILLYPRIKMQKKEAVAVALTALAIAVAATRVQVGFWNVVDAALLALIAAMLACIRVRVIAWGLFLATGFSIAVGGGWLILSARASDSAELSPSEAEQLLERDLSHWLNIRSGNTPAVVFAPPSTTTTLSFFGEFLGIANFDADNQASIQFLLRVFNATSLLEAQTLLEARQTKYIVLPSWDSFFRDYLSLSHQSDRSADFVQMLQQMDFPNWLRPIGYIPPRIGGYEKESVLVLVMTPDQSPAIAASRKVEYFLEIGKIDRANEAVRELKKYPGDIAALVAAAEVEKANQNETAFSDSIATIVRRLQYSRFKQPIVAWDRRVSLATILVQGRERGLAREQVQACIADATEERLRSLSPSAVRNLLLLSRGFNIPFANPELLVLARQLI